MVRKLARRLVDVDLLDQAAELLKYQAENRLDGVPRAQVATDLALIYLMDRKPEAALDAINCSRTTLLPTALHSQRRLLEARAWIQLNNLDHAAELLDGDRSAEAQALRAEVAWKRKDWAEAANSTRSVSAALRRRRAAPVAGGGAAPAARGDGLQPGRRRGIPRPPAQPLRRLRRPGRARPTRCAWPWPAPTAS